MMLATIFTVLVQTLSAQSLFNVNSIFTGNDIPYAVRESALKTIAVRSFSSKTGKPEIVLHKQDLALAPHFVDVWTSSGQDLQAAEVRYCTINKISPCPIYSQKDGGSAFLLNNARTLVTSYHLMHSTLADRFKSLPDSTDMTSPLRPLNRLALFLIGYDSQGQEVFNAWGSTRAITVQSFNPSIYFLANHNPNLFTGGLGAQLSDLAILNVPQLNIPAMTLASSLPDKGETVYCAGYPNKLSVGKAIQQNSGLRITAGEILAPADVANEIGEQDEGNFAELRSRFLIYADLDCNSGMSGGPILNSDGEVLGILTGYYQISKRKRICYGINLTAFAQLQPYWDQVNHTTFAH